MPKRTDWAAADSIALHVLQAHGGVAPLRAFMEAKLTKHQIGAILHRGVMNRPRTGWYSSIDLPWQGHRAVRVGGAATCVTAAALSGVPVPPDSHTLLHVHVDEHDTRLRHNRDKRHVVRSGDDREVVWHRRTLVDPAPWQTSLVDTLLQLAWCVPLEWFVAALDAVLHRPLDDSREPLLALEDYQRLVAALPRRFRRALDLVDARAESPIESLLRVAMVLAGIGPITSQFWPTSAYRVDFLVLRYLVVEADGGAFHDEEQDAIRDAAIRALGYRVLRFTYEQIVFHIDEVIAAIRAELVGMGLAFSS